MNKKVSPAISITIIFTLAVLVGLAAYYQDAIFPVQSPVFTVIHRRASNLNEYTNDVYGIRIKYTNEFPITSERCGGYIPICSSEFPIACFCYSGSNFSGTTFTGAGLLISIVSDNTEQSCKDFDYYDKQGLYISKLGETTVNDIVFSVAVRGGAALMHWSEERLYRTFRQGSCFEIAETITGGTYSPYGDLGNYKEFTKADKEKVLSSLETMFSTFRFIK